MSKCRLPIMVALLVLAVGCDTTGSPESGLLEVDDVTKDLGNLLPGEERKVDFQLRNEGKDGLRLSGLSTSCGCAPATLSSESIPPGGKATLTMSIHATAHPGQFAHSVSFETNSKDQPRVRLFVKGKAEWPVDVSPKTIYVPTMHVGDTHRGEIRVYSLERKPVRIVSASSKNSRISIEPSETAGNDVVIPFSVDSSMAGKITAVVEVETGDDRRPVVKVPVDVTINDDVAVLPKSVLLGPQNPGTTVQRSFTVLMPADVEVETITFSSTDWELVDFKVRRLNERQSQLDVILKVPVREGYHRSDLLVTCAGAGQPLSSHLSCLVSTASEAGVSSDE